MSGDAPGGAVTVLAAVGTAVVTTCALSLVLRGRSLDVVSGLWITLNAPVGVLALWIAALVLQRRARHGVGRILLAMGIVSVLHVVAATWADVALVASGHRERIPSSQRAA